ncbi:TetR/AcrR family transcriptional regulator [Lapidilactobacillus achengensis]|uniref:TetR/AcrR family transcriptional regulator n=1 Tax=Lapidilactobacillus achengensis TaxID=2486000 RepID=A0ABW1UUB7_9LACO|nr:TetR/AcrR family transcriptional regulator [Lapidilactobacillus achengensis]
MPKDTFLNLPPTRQKEIEQLLLEIFYNRPVSQVKVTEIVERMEMSRGAFYKYFEDLNDAYHYTLAQNAKIIRHDILRCIDDNQEDFFVGIEHYLAKCGQLKPNTRYWRRINLLTRSNSELAVREISPGNTTAFVDRVIEVIRKNQFNIRDDNEMISFLYFILEIIIDSLTAMVVNHWDSDQLLTDFRYKRKWLVGNLG